MVFINCIKLALPRLASGYDDRFVGKWSMTCIVPRFVVIVVKSTP